MNENELGMRTNIMENAENTEQDIDIDDIGTILKSSRLKNKKSLEEISSELCIRKIYLTALEEGDYETLPPIPYGVGYVRTYARYLGLSPERAVKLYKASFQTEEEGEEEPVVQEANSSNNWHIVAGFAVLAVIIGLWNLCGGKTKEQVKEENVVNEEIVAVVEEIPADTEEEKETVDTITETEEDITVEKAEHKEKTAENKKDEKISQTGITLIFSGETWIEVKDKNKVYAQGVFHNGDRKDITYVKNMFISVGRPQNVKIFVKGKEKNLREKNRKSNIPVDSLN